MLYHVTMDTAAETCLGCWNASHHKQMLVMKESQSFSCFHLIFPHCESTGSPIPIPHTTSNTLPLTRPLNANQPPYLAFCSWPVCICVHVKLYRRTPPTGGGPHLSESTLSIMSLKLGQMWRGISYINTERGIPSGYGGMSWKTIDHRVKEAYCTYQKKLYFWIHFDRRQGWATPVLEGHCPAEFNFNPN